MDIFWNYTIIAVVRNQRILNVSFQHYKTGNLVSSGIAVHFVPEQSIHNNEVAVLTGWP